MTKAKTAKRLKAWAGAWQRKLSETATVSRVDEDVPTDKQTPQRKPWFIALTRAPGLRSDVDDLDLGTVPDGTTVLLSEDEVLALVEYLFEPQTAIWSENPDPKEPGEYVCAFFRQPGMLATKRGTIVNGEAPWTPKYFTQQQTCSPAKQLPKRHTLPWPMPPDEK